MTFASASLQRNRATSRSLLTRVATGAAASAVLAAALAAAATSLLATYFVRRADDRRVRDAAVVLAAELDEARVRSSSVVQVVADEDREMGHTGIAFAVFSTNGDQYLAGDPKLPWVGFDSCVVAGNLRACGTRTRSELSVVAATAHTHIAAVLVLSSVLAAVLAGVGAWLASRPVAELLIGPLSNLRMRVEAIDWRGRREVDLGAAEGFTEVDALRDTIRHLLDRIGEAVRHAERFAADAAHELRTPLTALRGELESLAADATLSPNAAVNLARARRKVVELQVLVERLLVLALPYQGHWSASELVSLYALSESGFLQLSDSERERVRLSEPVGDVVVRGDTILLGMLLTNALGNALKFASRVDVSVCEADGDVLWQFDDDGPGVAEQHRKAVFEAFVRLPSAGRPVPGHGLGLAIIAHVARRHGGSVRFIDGAAGAHLQVRLPRASAAAASSLT